jgi:drug/metabolite transporter (DMT)-like permease
MLAIVAGGAALSWQGRLEWGGAAGPLLVACACLGWAIDNNLTQKVSASDPVQIAAIKGLVAGTVNLTIGLSLHGARPSVPRIAATLALGFVSYGVSLVLFVLAMRSLGTARTGAYFSLAPFVGAAGGLILWHDRATPLFFTAAALMALGLWLHLTERHEHVHTHAPLTHTHRHVHDEHHQHVHREEDPPGEPHTHEHTHEPVRHSHAHTPDIHHRHEHQGAATDTGSLEHRHE